MFNDGRNDANRGLPPKPQGNTSALGYQIYLTGHAAGSKK